MSDHTASMFFDSRVRRIDRRHRLVKVVMAILLTALAVTMVLQLAS